MPDMTATLLEQYQQDLEMEAAGDPALTEKAGTIIERKDSWGMRPAVAEATGEWVTLYHRVTGHPHIINKNNAKDAALRVFRQKDVLVGIPPELVGQTVFTVHPETEPKYGKHLCWLHPDYPGAPERHEQGFPVCRSEKLASPFHVEAHVRLKHRAAYDAMMRERAESDRREQLKLQQSQIDALMAVAKAQGMVPSVEPINESVVISEPKIKRRKVTRRKKVV